MSGYLAYMKIAFKRNTAYRMDFFLGILNTCLQIFVSCAIWKVLYGANASINNISFSMITTNFIISLGLSNAFAINDGAVQTKIMDGSISNDLLRPIGFRGALLADNLGNIFFKLLANFTPAVIISGIFIGFEAPVSFSAFLLFLLSVVLGFLVFYSLSLIVQMTSFWIINVWSLATITKVIINVLSGAMLPLWFMPDYILNVIKYTPFDSIYFLPVQIYLGQISGTAVLFYFAKQLLWFVVLYGISTLMWKFGQKKIIVQGG